MTLTETILLAVKHTFEGADGKISPRKTSAFWFVVLITLTHMVLFFVAIFRGQAKLLIDTLAIDVLAIFILFGLTTVSSILSFWKGRPEEKEGNKEG